MIATTMQCLVCSGTGIDPGFGDECVKCSGSGSKQTVVQTKPERTTGPTAKQSAFFGTISTELLALTDDPAMRIAQQTIIDKFADMTPKQASSVIDFMLGSLRTARQTSRRAATAELEPGLYSRDGLTIKVQRSATGNLYGKVLDETTGKYEYAAGSLRGVTAADRMTLEVAAEITRRIGRCCVCSRTLSNPDSIDAGIGPVCAGKL